MKQVTITSKSVEEAVEEALAQLRASKDKVEIEIIEESKKGFLGLGAKPATVKVTLNADPLEEAVQFLKEVASKMGVEVDVTVKEDEEGTILEMASEKIAILIGKRGQTLNALQYLTNLVANKSSDEFKRMILDAENYRERRKETLEKLAYRLASKALKINKKVSLEPMPSMERKVIHMTLKSNSKVQTSSEGSEPHRRVIITPTNE
ncbi:RNA-binding cell elongation regulator Jag/EloR [Pseudalkalibacillus salsuginis]|uniref:RNA-binding cell elongation regulator Jag/EloR n=1 Tax=Pseudalkalibacillus salsuginis TaxID=2910972 RepID=UPI001F1CEBEF|nr:RNA-binding cell elongation regulator Jag/EloR [Pseudalkalibacillus salsuginis]MCF6410712.1 protein jag [Pseudalkalibacillus salsuginis]